MNDEKTEPIVFAGVLLIQDGSYLLQHRDDKPTIGNPDTYSVWGGRKQEGETPEEGAARELSEETSIKAKVSDLKKICDFQDTAEGPNVFGEKVHYFIYSLNVPKDEIVNHFEGQGVIKLPIGKAADQPRLNTITRQAVEFYEAETR